MLNCHSQNIIYIMTCKGCNIQYVGETVTRLSERMNVHRTSTTGCEHVIEHHKSCKSSFNVQILEKLPGIGYTPEGDVDPDMREKRLEREDYWIKTLRVIYPYGLNEKAKCKLSKNTSVVGIMYPPLPRTGIRPVRSRENRNNHESSLSSETFFREMKNQLQNNIKQSFNEIRKLMDKIKKKELKKIAMAILDQNSNNIYEIENEQCYLYVLDIIDTKLYKTTTKDCKSIPKHILSLPFINKGMEEIKLSKILRLQNVRQLLPEDLQGDDEIPMISFKLNAPIRNKILNQKETVASIIRKDDGSFDLESLPCECENSQFKDGHHNHILTGDLRIVENSKLRQLLTKGPNFREPQTINYGKCQTIINESLDSYITNLASKTNHTEEQLRIWNQAVKQKVSENIRNLKNRNKPSRTKPVLSNHEVKIYLEQLKSRYVIVPIDKAANNFAFICKRFYITRLLQEIGIPNENCETYKISNKNKQDIIQENVDLCKRFGMEVSERNNCLPVMYWLPKMHKNPIDARFIVASSTCATKPIASAVSKVFKLLFQQIRNFHAKSTFYSRYKKFWIVENSQPVIGKLNTVNKRKGAKCISTFDFKTLYTKIEHENLLSVLYDIIDTVYKGGKRKYIVFDNYKAYWAKRRKGKSFFTKSSLKAITKHLITLCFFEVGNILLTQVIGIPMGIDPAPFWANLYLYSYECKYINDLLRTDKIRALKYHGCSRFIDDMCCINDGGDFGLSFNNIYPPSMELKIEHQGNHATFLDLDIKIQDGEFIYKLYDKRDNFPFFIVRMPDRRSNIPSFVFYGSLMSEFLRIARNTVNFDDFLPRAYNLVQRICNQGGNRNNIAKQLKKAYNMHPTEFTKYHKTPEQILHDVYFSNNNN